MTRILHLSDPHFGTEQPRLVDQLLALAAELRPDATVISGDLTQRARAGQFAAARAFADRLPGPVLTVPGNHDMPLYALPLRMLAPFAGYRRAFGHDLEPRLILPGAVVQGVNTADPLAWKAGRLRPASADRLRAAFTAAPAGAHRIAVLHHAPVPAADGTPADIADPQGALAALAAAGAEVVLSGHTHMPHAGFAETSSGVLFLQVGTCVSTRLKTGANDFSLIALSPGAVTLRSWLARAGQPFAEAPAARFEKTATGWRKG
jgi:3',5'-cyclic AMP phosphodiesterase CpdA